MLTGIYYDVTKFVATNIIDVDCDWEFKDGDIDIRLNIKVKLGELLQPDTPSNQVESIS